MLGIDTSGFTPAQLAQLQAMAEGFERENDETKFRDLFGEIFVDAVGVDALRELPVVEATDVGLEKVSKYPEGKVRPHHLGEHSAVRGFDPVNRPFIAIKVDILDATGKKVAQVVEVIFIRHTIHELDDDGNVTRPQSAFADMHKNTLVTALQNKTDEGDSYKSLLYSSGGMSREEMGYVASLLAGAAIETRHSDIFRLKMA